MKNPYVLGDSGKELQRLNLQSDLLFDQRVIPLIKKSKRCLEIGCGAGANLATYTKLNPKLKYVDIDISEAAIQKASSTFSKNKNAGFFVMAADDLDFDDGEFDLVVIRLVLWSISKIASDVLMAANRVLKKGGCIYSYEPDDRLLLMHPAKKDRDDYIKFWQEMMQKKGADPFIGERVPYLMNEVGFQNIDIGIHATAAAGFQKSAFKSKMKNLENLLLTQAQKNDVEKKFKKSDLTQIRHQFANSGSEDFVVETYVSTIAFRK